MDLLYLQRKPTGYRSKFDGFGFATKSEALLAPIHSRVPASTEIHTMRLETTHRFDTVYCSYHPKARIYIETSNSQLKESKFQTELGSCCWPILQRKVGNQICLEAAEVVSDQTYPSQSDIWYRPST